MPSSSPLSNRVVGVLAQARERRRAEERGMESDGERETAVTNVPLGEAWVKKRCLV